MKSSFTPKLFTTLKFFNRKDFIKDTVAGIIVGIIAIPLSIALAIASGVSPQMGLYTAIIGGFIISFLGGSRIQIGGPTAAFVPIVYSISEQYGIDGLTIATVMAGIFLIIMGICRLGKLIKYIPYPVIIGFTGGIAVSIFFKQIKDFTGMPIAKMPSGFIDTCILYTKNFTQIAPETLLLGAFSMAILIFWSKIKLKFISIIPGSAIAIILTTLIAHFFALNVETIGSKYPDISGSFPSFSLPDNVSLELIRNLIAPALSIAILAGIESLLSAVVADGMIGGNHRSNAELIAQGVANIASPLFGGMPATGAIARTATNIRNGGRTPVAGIMHALTILFIMVVFMPYAKMIPITTLAAILIIVAYNMAEWKHFINYKEAILSDYIVLIITFSLTVIFDIVIAIETGMVMASFLFLKRVIETTEINLISSNEKMLDELDPDYERLNKYGEEIMLYEIKGALFFGAADKFMSIQKSLGFQTKVIIIKMQEVRMFDMTAIKFLNTFYDMCKHQGISLYITNLETKHIHTLKKLGFTYIIGEENICKNIKTAIDHYEKNKLDTA